MSIIGGSLSMRLLSKFRRSIDNIFYVLLRPDESVLIKGKAVGSLFLHPVSNPG